MRILTLCRLGLLLAPLTAGCGPTNAIPTEDRAAEMNLEQIGQMLREYQLSKGSPPKSLKQLLANPGGALGGVELARAGDVVVLYGTPLPDTKEEPGASPNEEVLAYGKDVPDKGGPVLLLNRTIRRMTADEFKAAPKVESTAK